MPDIRDEYKRKYELAVAKIMALDEAGFALAKLRAELVKDRDWFEREMKRDRND